MFRFRNNPTLFSLFFLLLSVSSYAQQNLFNVPSGDLVAPRHFFFQEQLNVNDILQSSTTFDYGPVENFEVGINLLDVEAAKLTTVDTDDVNALVLGNAQFHVFSLKSEAWGLSLGTQTGAVVQSPEKGNVASFDYAVNNFYVFGCTHLIAGAYWATGTFLNWHDQAGAMLGTEVSMIKDRLHFVADWMSGRHSLGVFVPGLVFYPAEKIALSLGYQIPNSTAQSKALVFEFTALNWGG